jgi:DNA adenine methylase
VKPPFAYYGGKTGLAKHLVALMPPHRTYIEPFFGSGAVFFSKSPVVNEIINDLDGGVVTFFRVLRDRPKELEAVCRLTPHARAEYAASTITEDLNELERARRFWVRVNQSFAKTAGKQTGFSVTTARNQSVPLSIAGRINRFEACAARLMQSTIECCDAAGLVERLATPDTVVYADPPYLAHTRRSRDRQRPADYLHDMGTEDEHRRLARVLRATPATVLLSGYPSPLYDELYADWWAVDFPVRVHSSNSVTAARGERVERVWSNRDLGVGRFDFNSLEAATT